MHGHLSSLLFAARGHRAILAVRVTHYMIASTEFSNGCAGTALRGDGKLAARGVGVPFMSQPHQQCAVYGADHSLAFDDIIAVLLRCAFESAYFAPLQPQFI